MLKVLRIHTHPHTHTHTQRDEDMKLKLNIWPSKVIGRQLAWSNYPPKTIITIILLTSGSLCTVLCTFALHEYAKTGNLANWPLCLILTNFEKMEGWSIHGQGGFDPPTPGSLFIISPSSRKKNQSDLLIKLRKFDFLISCPSLPP